MAIKGSLRAILLLAAVNGQVFASGGSIVGKVTGGGEAQREALVGATVLLQGTVRGTTTNTSGDYKILDIPPGMYTLQVSMVGYQRKIRAGIEVKENQTTVVDIVLNSTPVQVDQVVVTASKRAQSLQEVPVSVSVLDAAQIDLRNSQTIDDALRYIPGVNMTGSQVSIRGSSGYSRGAGSRVLMLLDGIPFITGDTGELNFESIPIGLVDRIEVVKGASSALYGSNALGGVINIITKEIPDKPTTMVRLYAGEYNKPSFQQWDWSSHPRFYEGQAFSHSFREGDLGVYLYLSHQADDGYRLNDYHRRYNVYLKVKEDYSANSSLVMNFGLLDQYSGQYLYWRNLDSALIPPALQQNDDVRSIRYFVNGTLNSVLSDRFLLSTKGMWYHNFWGFRTRSGGSQSQADDFRLSTTLTGMLDSVHTLTSGVDLSADAVAGDFFDRHTLGGFAVYGQDEMKLTRALTATLGLRYDFEAAGLTSPGGQINPKAALSYTPFEGTTLRASVGRGFRVPSVAEAFLQQSVNNLVTLPNKDLQPEKSVSYEIGASQTLGGMGTFDIAGFRSDYDNLIEAGLIVSGSNVEVQWRNVTQARVQGVETSLNLGFFGGGLTSSINYTYVYPQDLTAHDILKYRPRHLLYASLIGRIGGFTVESDFRYVSKMERIDEEFVLTGIVPDGDQLVDAKVVDVRAGMEFSIGSVPMKLTAAVNNLLQYNYVELIANLMPPRTYSLVLEMQP
jgi:outer membrane receptor for ferrienterochelin and colicins